MSTSSYTLRSQKKTQVSKEPLPSMATPASVQPEHSDESIVSDVTLKRRMSRSSSLSYLPEGATAQRPPGPHPVPSRPSSIAPSKNGSSSSRKKEAKLRAIQEEEKLMEEYIREKKKLVEEKESLMDLYFKMKSQKIGDRCDVETENGSDDEKEVVSNFSRKQNEEKVGSWIDQNSMHLDQDEFIEPPPVRMMQITQPENQPTESANAMNQLIEGLTKAITMGNSKSYLKRPELPIFGGRSSDWLPFKAAFNEMKTIHKFSDEVLLARMRRVIVGAAKETVGSMLYTESNPHKILEALEDCYGRPDELLMKHINEVKSMSPIRHFNEIVMFARKVENCVSAVQTLNQPGFLYSPELLSNIVGKLNRELRREWINYQEKTEQEDVPALLRLVNYLKEEAKKATKYGISERLANSTMTGGFIKNSPRQQNFSKQNEDKKQVYTVTEPKGCGFCNDNHHIYACAKFKDMSAVQRWDWIRNNNLCFLCLTNKHRRNTCRSKKCFKCNGSHNSLLHLNKNDRVSQSQPQQREEKASRENKEQPSSNDTSKEKDNSKSVVSCCAISEKSVLLRMIPVVITGPAGEVNTYAFMDSGSNVSLIEEDLAKQLGLQGPESTLHVNTLFSNSSRGSREVNFKIRGKYVDKEYEVQQVRTIPKLNLLPQTVGANDLTNCDHLDDILQEITYERARPTILIGEDNWELTYPKQLRSGKPSQPAASLTELGWVVHGCSTIEAPTQSFHIQQEEITDLLKQHFSLDSIGIKPMSIVTDDQAIATLKEKTTQLASGRYAVPLLWKKEDEKLHDNYNQALHRLKHIEKKMDGDPAFAKQYTEKIEDMIHKGYAEKINAEDEQATCIWYLPHFAVVNPNKPGKMRIVHDAAAKSRGVSLNDCLLSGPDLLQNLPGILYRFREGRYALSGDIKEMFPQVKILKEDQNAQRFLWRGDNRNGSPDIYKMSSMIFGATSSPCSAIYVKNYNAEKHAKDYPEAARVIIEDHYMDDCITSTNTLDEAKNLARDVTNIHAAAGFEMRDWASNNKEVLSLVPKSQCKGNDVELTKNMMDSVKTLGLLWDPESDTIGYAISLHKVPEEVTKGAKKPTKRQMLSLLMSIYDPQGLATPYVIRGKMLLQEVWKTNIDWDQELSDKEYQKWKVWLQDLESLKSLKIPRWYHTSCVEANVQLHIFSDASERAYGAVAYWRLDYGNGKVQVALIAAKSRVTPLKPSTIPRLELQAATLAARLAANIEKEHRLKPSERFFWTDSSTVYSWLHKDPTQYKTFVAHRLCEIREATQLDEWRWIPGAENVADEASRGQVGGLTFESRWFQGPGFLKKNKDLWPQQIRCKDEEPEERKKKAVVNVTVKPAYPAYLPKLEDISTFQRLKRVTGRVLQFIGILKKRTQDNKENHRQTTTVPRDERKISPIDDELLEKAEKLLIKQAQTEDFGDDLLRLERKENLHKKSRIIKLNPFLSDGILRCNGRIDRADVAEELKRPIILDGKNDLVRKIIYHYHERFLHANKETIINEIKQRFFIFGLRTAVKGVIGRCQLCMIRKALPSKPLCGDLPTERLGSQQRAFTYSGLDYFGPMDVTIGRKHEKRYGALFTCMTTRAIHIEVVSSLSTDSAIMALKRFISRRGCPKILMSDNATCFKGADNEIKRELANQEKEKLIKFAQNLDFKWKFIPPSSPFMGGTWERMVRSVKTALKAILHEKAPKEEVLHTLLLEAEAIVNARPLTHVAVECEDEEALTPYHFLIGTSSTVPVIGNTEDKDLLRRKNWKAAQRLADHFWKRWLKEYLPTLIPRTFKSDHQENLKVDDIVLIVDEELPRNVWPRGRVIEIHPGKDGIVRVADVKTKHGVLRRPARKLVKLPVQCPTTEKSHQ